MICVSGGMGHAPRDFWLKANICVCNLYQALLVKAFLKISVCLCAVRQEERLILGREDLALTIFTSKLGQFWLMECQLLSVAVFVRGLLAAFGTQSRRISPRDIY